MLQLQETGRIQAVCVMSKVMHVQAVCHGHHYHKEESGAAGKALNIILLPEAAVRGHGSIENGGDPEGGLHSHRAGQALLLAV